MIYINRAGHTPNHKWIAKADALTKELLNAKNKAERNQIIDANGNIWSELKDFLLLISSQKCWYSEAIETYNHLHVDHFRPKKAAIGLDKSDYGGYWWLTFEWRNFRVCGGVGNVRKKDKFAVRFYKSSDPTSPIDDEIIYFLDPTEEEDVLKLTFNSNGEATPINTNGWDFDRAQYTINSLNLNFKNLKEARKTVWIKCSNLILESQALIDQNNIYPSVHRRGLIKEKLKQLKELVAKSSPFSATAKACLKSSGVDWAISIAT